MIKIEIGPGKTPTPGYIGFDSKSSNYDIMFDDLPYTDNSINMIYASHVLEHIPLIKVEKSLKRFYKKLKVGGKLRIVVPDLKVFAKAYVENDVAFFEKSHFIAGNYAHFGLCAWFTNVILSYGNDTILKDVQKDRYITGIAHVCGFDFELLENIFKSVGFKNIVRTDIYKDDSHTAKGKPANTQIFMEGIK